MDDTNIFINENNSFLELIMHTPCNLKLEKAHSNYYTLIK